MSVISSKPAPDLDITAAGFRAAACDVGEVISLLATGVRPKPEVHARLAMSMRALRGFLLEEASQQDWREAISSGAIAEALSVPTPDGLSGMAPVQIVKEVS